MTPEPSLDCSCDMPNHDVTDDVTLMPTTDGMTFCATAETTLLAVLSTLMTVLFELPVSLNVNDERNLPPNITPAEATTPDIIAQTRQQAMSAGIDTLRFSFLFVGVGAAALYV